MVAKTSVVMALITVLMEFVGLGCLMLGTKFTVCIYAWVVGAPLIIDAAFWFFIIPRKNFSDAQTVLIVRTINGMLCILGGVSVYLMRFGYIGHLDSVCLGVGGLAITMSGFLSLFNVNRSPRSAFDRKGYQYA